MTAIHKMRVCLRLQSGSASPVFALVLAAIVLLVLGLRGNAYVKQERENPVRGQSQEAAAQKSTGCIGCHSPMDEATMHPTKTV